MRLWQKGVLAVMMGVIGGCAGVRDIPKSIWGSTTRVLEEERTNALIKTYDKNYWDCYKAALGVVNKKKLVLFKKDEVRGYMVLMGIPGSVDTTEVGVFLVELGDQKTRIELSSLSTNAKRLLAKTLFHGMDIAFGLAAPDKEDGFAEIEFKNGLSPEALRKVIEDDGFSVPSKDSVIDSLNSFLENVKFYDDWQIKHKSITLSQVALDLIAIKEKNVIEIKQLNRLILEATYPAVCPVTNRVPRNEGKMDQGATINRESPA